MAIREKVCDTSTFSSSSLTSWKSVLELDIAPGGHGGQQGEVLKGLLVLGCGSPGMEEMGMLLLGAQESPCGVLCRPLFP